MPRKKDENKFVEIEGVKCEVKDPKRKAITLAYQEHLKEGIAAYEATVTRWVEPKRIYRDNLLINIKIAPFVLGWLRRPEDPDDYRLIAGHITAEELAEKRAKEAAKNKKKTRRKSNSPKTAKKSPKTTSKTKSAKKSAKKSATKKPSGTVDSGKSATKKPNSPKTAKTSPKKKTAPKKNAAPKKSSK